MSTKEAIIETIGEVIQILPNSTFKVRLDNKAVILGHMCGKMKQNFISVLIGDKVTIEISKYDLTKGRVTFRHKPPKKS